MAEQLELDGGCLWIVGTTMRGVKKGQKPLNVFCNKLRDRDAVYCPKHVLFAIDEEQKPFRAAMIRQGHKEWKREQQRALEASPLRAENPEYQTKTPKRQRAANSEERAFG